GVDLPRLREALTTIVGRGNTSVSGDISLTPRAKLVVEQAIEEARVLRHNTIGTEHLLLGVAHAAVDGISVRMLQHCGVDLGALRKATLDLLAGESERLLGSTGEGAAPATASARQRDNVVTCRVDDQSLGALDALVEAGVHSTRSEAAARLILAGIQANQALFKRVNDAVAEIRRVRSETQALVRMWDEGSPVDAVDEGASAPPQEQAVVEPAVADVPPRSQATSVEEAPPSGRRRGGRTRGRSGQA
ncbi:MAG: hypothetical protein M3442_16655, partial [Chloroflexota bacterium]|nr:hypothetical protein [Chloroflexota bacterium]